MKERKIKKNGDRSRGRKRKEKRERERERERERDLEGEKLLTRKFLCPLSFYFNSFNRFLLSSFFCDGKQTKKTQKDNK